MKKIIIYFCTILFLIIIISCNNQKKQKFKNNDIISFMICSSSLREKYEITFEENRMFVKYSYNIIPDSSIIYLDTCFVINEYYLKKMEMIKLKIANIKDPLIQKHSKDASVYILKYNGKKMLLFYDYDENNLISEIYNISKNVSSLNFEISKF